MSRPVNILVLANQTAESEDLVAALEARSRTGPARFTLLMPAAGPGVAGRRAAEPRLQEALERWRAAGLDVDGMVGGYEPLDAVLEAWDPRRYDEILVSTLPGHASRWMQHDLPHRIARGTDARVSHVVSATPQVQPNWEPAPARTRSSMGPLAVLAWGHPVDER